MANTLANIARVVSATTGTGTLTLGAAVQGFNTFADAGITNGQTVTYAIEDYTAGVVSAREVGVGVYNTAGPTLTRATVYSSTSAGAKINCSGTQQVFITVAKEDIDTLGGALADGDYGDIVVSGSGTVLSIDSGVATTFGRSLMDDADASAGRTTLGLGTMATETASNYLTTAAAASGYQPLDGDLTSIAALTTDAYGRSLLTTTSEANFKATVNLEIGTDVQAYDAELAAIAGLTSAADRLPYFTGSGTAALATFTTAGRNLLDDADTATQRTTLGLGTGDSPQFTAVNIGNASDTTIARVSAGVISVEGNTVAMLNTLNTFTQNQLIQKASGNLNIIATSGDATNYVAAVSGNAATTRWVHWTGAAVSDRWLFGKDATAESGSDAGSNFACYNYTDAGAFKAVAFTMQRSDNSVNWRGGQYSNGVTGGSQGNGTLNFATLYENGTSLAAKYQPLDADLTTIAGLAAPGADRILFWDHSASAYAYLTAGTGLTITGTTITASGATVADSDYGDVTVSSSGTVWTIDNDAVTYAKMQNTGAGNVVLTRADAAAGNIGETALAASQLLGRGSTGNVAAITLGSGLSMSGTTLSASGGGGGTYGTATLNFGSAPGTNMVTTTITGQTGILSGSTISAWLMAEATATHNAYEHMIVPLRITCGNIVAGTGFDIVAVSDLRLTGTFTCRWEGNY